MVKKIIKEGFGELLRRIAGTTTASRTLNRISVGRDDLLSENDGPWELHQLNQDMRVTYSEPATGPPYPPAVSRRIAERFCLTGPFVIEVPDAQIVGRRGVTLTNDGRYIREASALSNRELLLQNLAVTAADRQFPVRRPGTMRSLDGAVSLVGSWNFGYFHWTTDWLGRLAILEQFERKHNTTEVPVIIPPKSTAWMRESLRLAGIPPHRQYTWDGSRLAVNRLLIPSVPRIVYDESPADVDVLLPDALQWIRKTIRTATDDRTPPSGVSRRLYVSRTDADDRRVRNEKMLLETLREFGFTRFVPSKYSVAKQVAAFREAEIIVGPHGAGMTNALYANDAVLLEFFGNRVATCYLTLTDDISVKYGILQAQAVGTDMRVEPETVIETLASMGIDL